MGLLAEREREREIEREREGERESEREGEREICVPQPFPCLADLLQRLRLCCDSSAALLV